MKKKEYKVQFENGLIQPLEPIDVKGIHIAKMIFLDLSNDSLELKKQSTNKLSKYAGSWSGNDLEECMKSLKENKSDAEF